MIGAEEIEAADGRGARAFDRGVAVKILEIIERPLLQRFEDRAVILVRGAHAELIEGMADAAFEIGHHAAEMMRDDFQIGETVHDAGEDQPRQRHAGLVGPAEHAADLVFRILSRSDNPACRGCAPDAAGSACRIWRSLRRSAGTPARRAARHWRWCRAARHWRRCASARSASLAAASGAFIGNSADQPTKCFGCLATTSASPSLAIFAMSGDLSGPHSRSIGGRPWDRSCA